MNHHLSDATLLAHVAGRLPAPHAIVARTHLALCPACRASARLAMAVGGTLIEESAAAPLAADALSRTLARLADPAPPPEPAHIPLSVADFATGRWWWIGPGIRMMPLIRRDRDDARLDLIRVVPGTALPGHGHTGSELTCVLAGAFADETGEYRPGDIAEGDPGLDHAPVAVRHGPGAHGGECVCLIATTGRLRAHSWLARLVQPMVGI